MGMVIYCNCQEQAVKDNLSNGEIIYICDQKKCNFICYTSNIMSTPGGKLFCECIDKEIDLDIKYLYTNYQKSCETNKILPIPLNYMNLILEIKKKLDPEYLLN